MATRDCIIPVRVTRADRALLRRVAPGGAVSSWLRDLALAEARKRQAAVEVARLLDQAQEEGFGLDETPATALAAEAVSWARRRRR